MSGVERKVITTSIPYVNAKPHIGFALEAVYADVLARYYRKSIGDTNVRFLSGTDEHGQKIQRKAEALGKEPQAFVDAMSQRYRDLLRQLNISNNDFIRTTEERHIRGAQKFWRLMQTRGFVEKREFEGLYCVGCEEYKTEKELIDGKCSNHNLAPELLKEENYFFLLSKLEPQVKAILARDGFVIPEHRKKEMLEFVNRGLQDIPISRPVEKLSWGISVPGDTTQVMYVWVEAITNYITALGFGTNDEWTVWWSWVTHVIGKDINRFHAVMWPAMLLAAGMELPTQIAVHGFITVNGKKMSKTLGNVIAPEELVARYGVDATRYLLMAEIPFAGDGDFSWERFDALYTSQLVNGLGNTFSRVTNMIEKYCDGRITPDDHGEIPKRTLDGLQDTSDDMASFRFQSILDALSVRVSALDEYLEMHQPWQLAKNNESQLRHVLEQSLSILVSITEELTPFMPDTVEKMMSILHAERIMKPLEPLFPRLSDKK